MKPFLILQLRPEQQASDEEFTAFLEKGGLRREQTHRIELNKTPLPDDLDIGNYSGVIVGGGPGCVSDPAEKKSAVEAQIEEQILGLMPRIVERDFPFLGCCYGIGILAHFLGAKVNKERFSEEVGLSRVAQIPGNARDALLEGLPEDFDAFLGHKEAVQEMPAGCVHLLSSPACPFQMIRYRENVYATQFHPEGDGPGFETRIKIYRNRGYFDPDDADRLIALCRASDVHAPPKILRNFVARYCPS